MPKLKCKMVAWTVTLFSFDRSRCSGDTTPIYIGTYTHLSVRSVPYTYHVMIYEETLTLVPHRGFAIFEFAKKRRETFVKRTFARWRALSLRRDLTRA